MRDACREANRELEETQRELEELNANLLEIVEECRQQMRIQFLKYREQKGAEIQHWMNGFADKLIEIEELERLQKQDHYQLTQLREQVEHLERQLQQSDPWQFKGLQYQAPKLP